MEPDSLLILMEVVQANVDTIKVCLFVLVGLAGATYFCKCLGWFK